ncbi:MAG: cation transporter [Actinobacteria bacterium]|nr:MAG: cation transporter [Actinomycetota bacterium]
MTHGHHHHHTVSADADRGPMLVALVLIGGLMAAEIAAGLIAGSVALLTDAAHMLTDAGAIALGLMALRLAARPPGGAMTYGLKRVEPLSAAINGAVLAVLALVFTIEAISRLANPHEVEAALVLVVALVAIPVNVVAVRALARANRESVNVEGVFQHILTDLYAFIATAIAAVVILATGFDRADAIAALFVAALMTRAAVSLLRDSGRIFLEAAPAGLEPDAVGHALAAYPGVVSVHDLHVWEVTSGFPSLSAHIVVGWDDDCHDCRAGLERMLRERFGLDHTTLQVEHEPKTLLSIE